MLPPSRNCNSTVSGGEVNTLTNFEVSQEFLVENKAIKSVF